MLSRQRWVGRSSPRAAGGKAAPTAPPPIVWPSPPLADGPIMLDTGIQHQIRLIVTKRFNQPWSMAFLPDGNILVTERPGRLRIVRNGVLGPNAIAGVPKVQAQGLAGLMDLALHPRFSDNKLVYFISYIFWVSIPRIFGAFVTRKWLRNSLEAIASASSLSVDRIFAGSILRQDALRRSLWNDLSHTQVRIGPTRIPNCHLIYVA